MKTYRAKFNPNSENVYGVSLVENPAMEGNFIQFSKQDKIQFADVDKDKRRIMGLILEPNKLVYRNQGGEEFNILFTEQDIEDVAYNFQKQQNQNNSTLEHDGNMIEGVSFVETWLVENPKIDKSTNFGFNYPKGSWMGVMQIDNDEVWNDYVKSGSVKGFSIDAFMHLEEVNFKSNIEMSEIKEDNLVTKIVDAVKLAWNSKKEVEKVDEVELTKEVKEIETKSEEVKSTETKEAEKEVKLSDESLAEFLSELDKLFTPIKEENIALKKQLENIEAKLTKQSEKLIELSEQPATKSIKSKPTQVDFSKMTELEKRQYWRNNG